MFILKHKNDVKLHDWGLFDTHLVAAGDNDNSMSNVNLQILLKIYLEPINKGKEYSISDGEKGYKFAANDWPPEIWKKFKSAYVNTGTAFWNKKFWLKTPEGYTGFNSEIDPCEHRTVTETRRANILLEMVCGVVKHQRLFEQNTRRMVRPNVNCLFQILLLDKPNSYKTHIKAHYITHKLVGKTREAIGEGITGFRPDNLTYSQSDILEQDMDYNGITIKFKTHVHEIGHTMGLEHAAFVRSEDPCMKAVKKNKDGGKNSDVCYASSLDSAKDVMGKGNALSIFDALAWQEAAKLLTGYGKRDDWKVSLTPLYPEFI